MRADNLIRFIFLAVFAAGVSSCSIKESREDCDCFYTVKCSTSEDLTIFFCDNNGQILSKQDLTQEQLVSGENVTLLKVQDLQIIGVPTHAAKDEHTSSFTSAFYESLQEEGIIPGESYLISTQLHRQFTTLRVTLQLPSGSSDNPDELVIHSNYNGFFIPSLTPSVGAYSVKMAATDNKTYQTDIYRQGNNSLMLDIKRKGTALCTIPIGRSIEAMGYDWFAKELKDISIFVNLQALFFSVSVDGWQKEESFVIVSGR